MGLKRSEWIKMDLLIGSWGSCTELGIKDFFDLVNLPNHETQITDQSKIQGRNSNMKKSSNSPRIQKLNDREQILRISIKISEIWEFFKNCNHV